MPFATKDTKEKEKKELLKPFVILDSVVKTTERIGGLRVKTLQHRSDEHRRNHSNPLCFFVTFVVKRYAGSE